MNRSLLSSCETRLSHPFGAQGMATLSRDELDTVYALARVARRYDPGINDFYFIKDGAGKEHLVFRNTRRDLHVIVAEVVQHEDAAHGRLEAFRYFPERNAFRRDYGASDNLLMHRCYQAYDAMGAAAASASAAASVPFHWLAQQLRPRRAAAMPAAADHVANVAFPHHVPKPAAAKPAVNAHYHAHGHAPAHPSGKPPLEHGKPQTEHGKPTMPPGTRDTRRDSGRMI
jgi:hypothetical protein